MPDPIYGPIGGCAPGAVGYGNQAATLSQARSHPMGILPRERLELTRFSTMLGDWYRLMDDLEGHPELKFGWYTKKLGKYFDQLEESAEANRIPMQLLAAVVLNELADIDQKDVLQQQLITNLNSGSLGMGQINVHTALKHGLLRGFLATPSASTAAQLLAVPQYSIEAAAREIRHLLDLMEHDPKAPWPARFKFAPPPPGDRDPMRYYRKGVITVPDKDTEEDREALFARMVASAYNGGDAFLGVAAPNKSQPNSWIHGANAESIARDLYQFQLYRSPCSPAQAAEKGVEKHRVAPGESLSKIAQTYYKDMHLWPLIHDENKKLIGSDPNKLKAGVELVIPDLSEIDPIRIREAKRRAALGPSATSVPVAPAR